MPGLGQFNFAQWRVALRRAALSNERTSSNHLIDYCARRFATVALAVIVLATIAHAQHAVRYVGRLTGVNIAGAEFNGRKVPGVPNQDYFYPAMPTIDYFASNGMNSIRVPFLWERVQPQLGAALDSAELQCLEDVVRYANDKGLYVVLDVRKRYIGIGLA